MPTTSILPAHAKKDLTLTTHCVTFSANMLSRTYYCGIDATQARINAFGRVCPMHASRTYLAYEASLMRRRYRLNFLIILSLLVCFSLSWAHVPCHSSNRPFCKHTECLVCTWVSDLGHGLVSSFPMLSGALGMQCVIVHIPTQRPYIVCFRRVLVRSPPSLPA